MPNHLLEELASDVYDEVDRRETDASKSYYQITYVVEVKARQYTVLETLISIFMNNIFNM